MKESRNLNYLENTSYVHQFLVSGVLTESDFSVKLLLPKRNKNEAGAGYGKNWSSN